MALMMCCQIQRAYNYPINFFEIIYLFIIIRFQEKAAIQSRVYKDQQMKPCDRAVYWVEYVIRNRGAENLKSNSIGLNDLQYFLFDVLSILFTCSVLVAFLGYLIINKITSKKSYS